MTEGGEGGREGGREGGEMWVCSRKEGKVRLDVAIE